jgi:beta-barrel assembly-enhancing protease
MKQTFLLILTILLPFWIAFGQDFKDYRPLLSKGALPSEVITSATAKFEAEKEPGNSKEENLSNRFLLRSRFETDMILRSRLIVHDTSFTNYFGRIADELLKDKPELRKKLHFYLLKSSAVNAFAFQDGSIFICMGTLAHIENEAQLAFILAHEIVHVEKSHSLNRYLEFKNIDGKKKDKDRVIGFQDKKTISASVLQKCRFNQDQESEADTVGLQQFLKSSYNFESCEGVYKHLKYSYLPYDSIPFSTTFLGVNGIDLEERYFRVKLNPIKGISENENDSTATHPNIGRRKAATLKTLAGLEAKGKEDFVVSQQMFENMQTIARFELPHLFLHEGLFEDAIYYSYLLSFNYPENAYLEKNIGGALYGLAKMKYEGSFNHHSQHSKSDLDSLEGERQQVYHFFDTLNFKQVVAVASNYLWKLKEKYPKEETLSDMWKETTQGLINLDALKISDFLPMPSDGIAKTEKNWEKYIFSDLLNEKDFKNLFNSETVKKKRQKIAVSKSFADYSDLDKKASKALKLGISKVVIVNPTYAKLSTQPKDKQLFIEETEAGKDALIDILKENAKLVKIEAEVLHVFNMESNNTPEFNDMNMLEEWVDEQIRTGNVHFLGTQQAEINALAKKYGTDYFMWVGIWDVKLPPNYVRALIWLNALYIPPLWIPALYNSFKTDNATLMYAVVYDVKTGKSQVIKKNFYHKKNSKAMMNLQCYDMFWQLKRGKPRQ